MIILGVDPGMSGGLALIELKKDKIINVQLFDMPTLDTIGSGKTKGGKPKKHTIIDEPELRNIFTSKKIDHAFIEKAQSMPGQGVSSVGSYMCGYGILRGMCSALQIPYDLCHPATWKRVVMKDLDRGKEAAIVRAKQLFPMADIGKGKDGIAEALLIAWYGKNIL
jgi:crossover junction endodeoxyribonuclease RuvC